MILNAEEAIFSILITTKNRREALFFTLNKIRTLLERKDVLCVVFDDGSEDETSAMVKKYFPKIELLRNESSKGYLFCRNKMLNSTTAKYAISLDDDAHFLNENPLESIEDYFKQNPKCGAIAFRIWWDKGNNEYIHTNEKPAVVKSFVGCGHAWNKTIWNQIEDYPEWFEFYGEEDFASMQLYQKGFTVDYVPEILVQHRVDLLARANIDKDGAIRYRRSFRSGWYLYFIFYPFSEIPRRLLYTFWIQLKRRVFNGNLMSMFPLMHAIVDVIRNAGKLSSMRKPFTKSQFFKYSKLPQSKIYWNPETSQKVQS